jgi:hypothetical protein
MNRGPLHSFTKQHDHVVGRERVHDTLQPSVEIFNARRFRDFTKDRLAANIVIEADEKADAMQPDFLLIRRVSAATPPKAERVTCACIHVRSGTSMGKEQVRRDDLGFAWLRDIPAEERENLYSDLNEPE